MANLKDFEREPVVYLVAAFGFAFVTLIFVAMLISVNAAQKEVERLSSEFAELIGFYRNLSNAGKQSEAAFFASLIKANDDNHKAGDWLTNFFKWAPLALGILATLACFALAADIPKGFKHDLPNIVP